MSKGFDAWVAVDPEGRFFPNAGGRTRQHALSELKKYGGEEWKILYRKGWRVVKVKFEVVG